jgi:hypothetical protein
VAAERGDGRVRGGWRDGGWHTHNQILCSYFLPHLISIQRSPPSGLRSPLSPLRFSVLTLPNTLYDIIHSTGVIKPEWFIDTLVGGARTAYRILLNLTWDSGACKNKLTSASQRPIVVPRLAVTAERGGGESKDKTNKI